MTNQPESETFDHMLTAFAQMIADAEDKPDENDRRKEAFAYARGWLNERRSQQPDTELRQKLIEALAGTATGFHSSQLEAIWPIIAAECQAAEEQGIRRGAGKVLELVRPYVTYKQLETINAALRSASRKESHE